jgi:glycosyltransferase involved in cell wall biosynthesis
MKVFYPFLEFIGLYHYMSRTKLSEDFCRWLDDFRPDVIYDQPSTRDSILFCLDVHSYLGKPLILHMMDDWPSTISDRGIFKKFWNRIIDQEFRRLLDRTSILMSISHEMAREYKSRYGKDFITFHNAIDLDFWNQRQRRSYDLGDSPTILYAGRIGLGIESSLELFVRAIEQINSEINLSVKFMLQTQEKPQWIDNYKSVIHNKFVSYSDLPKVFSEADFLLLPYDFTPEAIKYIRYSMPTKAPEYMVSGTPIIIFAPEETAIVKYAEREEWAKVITENRIAEIAESVKQLIADKELRQRIAQNAIEIARKNHNSNDVKRKFKEIIASVVGVS